MRPISQCFNKQLTDLRQRTSQLGKLAENINQLLPKPFTTQYQVGSFNKGCLVLTASSAEWASQLNYLLPELRDKLRQSGWHQLSSIKILLASPIPYEKSPKPSGYRLSEKAKAVILSESQHCTYEPLQKALLKLAENEKSDE